MALTLVSVFRRYNSEIDLNLESLLFCSELPFQLLHSLHLIVKLKVWKRIGVKVVFFLILILKETEGLFILKILI